MSSTDTSDLYGDPSYLVPSDYEPSDDYKDQGDKRVVRDLMFSYQVQIPDPVTGGTNLMTIEAHQNDEVTTDQIGKIALAKGEANHSFFTDEEVAAMEAGEDPNAPLALEPGSSISSFGEHELADWLESDNPATGRAWTVNEVLQKVGTDKDLAQRMLAAENVRSSNDPRHGLEVGLTKIIEG